MSDIDWSEAPEGATHYAIGKEGIVYYKDTDNGTKAMFKDDDYWIDSSGDLTWILGNIKQLPPSKPVYTQAMADNGELPLVGMDVEFETTFFTTVTSNSGTCEIIAYYGDKVWINIIDFDCVININVIEFKPIEPPIELIDGKAYQFELRGETRIGTYCLKDDDFKGYVSNRWTPDLCTNIQLLEVKS